MSRGEIDVSNEAFLAAGRALAELWRCMLGYPMAGVALTGLSVRPPRYEGDETLIVLRGEDEAGQTVVAFHSAYMLTDAVSGAWTRHKNGTLKWKADQFR